MAQLTEYLLFIDESGTHDLNTVDPKWPVFVLVGLLIGEQYYQRTLVPRVKALKAKFALDATIVLHSRHIRRCEGAFAFLHDPAVRSEFHASIDAVVRMSRFRLFA